jgi:hypothetical protein
VTSHGGRHGCRRRGLPFDIYCGLGGFCCKEGRHAMKDGACAGDEGWARGCGSVWQPPGVCACTMYGVGGGTVEHQRGGVSLQGGEGLWMEGGQCAPADGVGVADAECAELAVGCGVHGVGGPAAHSARSQSWRGGSGHAKP